MEAPHGQAQATAPLLQSRVEEEATTADLAVAVLLGLPEEVVEVEEMLQPSPTGGTNVPQNRPVLPMGGGLNPGTPAIPSFGNPLPPVTFGAGAARGNTGSSGGDRFDAYNKNPMMNQRRY